MQWCSNSEEKKVEMCFFHSYKVAFTVRVSTETIFFIDFIKDSEIGKCWLPYISYRIIFWEGSVLGEGVDGCCFDTRRTDFLSM